MMCSILIGTAVALGVSRLIARRRGCGGGGGGHYGRWGSWRRRRGPWGMFEELGLDEKQRVEVTELMQRAKNAFEPLKQERSQWKSVAEAIVGEEFDRIKIEEAAARVQIGLDHAKDELLEVFEKLHATLSPDQRARLATRFGVTFGPAGGPYRT